MFHLRNMILVLGLCCSVLTGCGVLELKDRLLDVMVEQVPISLELELGQQALKGILPESKRVRDKVLQQQLEDLVGRLIEANALSKPPIRIFISRDSELNAFALPGGFLIFNSGMLLAAASPEEILGVAAHEIAHATERHVMRGMIQSLGLAAVASFFLGDASGLLAFFLDQAQVLVQRGFSRVHEAEADAVGFVYLTKARIDPRGMSRFFNRLMAERGKNLGNKESNKDLDKITNFFSTHPLTEERIAEIEKRWEGLPASEKRRITSVRFELKAFQQRLQSVLGKP